MKQEQAAADPQTPVEVEQTRLVFSQTRAGLIATLINAALLALLLAGAVPSATVVSWLALMVAVSAARWLLAAAYRRREPGAQDCARWRTRFIAGAAAAGLAWGAAAVVLFAPESPAHQAFLALVLAGMTAGAVPVLASVYGAYLAFALPALLPLAARFALAGGELHFAMALLAFVFVAMMAVAARRVHATLTASLVLRFENEGLLARLAAEKERTERFNETLERCVVERTAELRAASAALEAEKTEQQALIAELRQTQQQLLQSEKMAAIGSLAAGVAHEINNPVGYIGTNLSVLSKYLGKLLRVLGAYERHAPGLPPAAAKEVEALRTEVGLDHVRQDGEALVEESLEGMARIRRIVQDLKDFSHPDEGEWQWADLQQGIESTLNIVHHELKYKAEVVREYGELPLIECQAAALNQVFLNLLVNAAQAIETRGRITIRTGTHHEAAFVEIADSGRGIAPEHLNRLFEPFFTTKPPGQGTGLGLSLSWGIVERHGGRIEVESTPGAGATFRVWLPLRRAEAKPDQHETEHRQEARA